MVEEHAKESVGARRLLIAEKRFLESFRKVLYYKALRAPREGGANVSARVEGAGCGRLCERFDN